MGLVGRVVTFVLAAALAAIAWLGPMTSNAVAHEIEMTPPEVVVPGPGLPAGLDLYRANNNLDVTWHDGRLFLAFRTSWVHFASPWTLIQVVSSGDGGVTWQSETTVDRGRDMREPRFLSWNGKLFLYFFEAGVNPFDFEPGAIFALEKAGGTWTEPMPITELGYVVWRTKVVDGVPYMTRYRGGESIYNLTSDPIEIELMTTDDGYEWHPVDPEHPIVYAGGGSETAFAFAGDGRLFSVIRNEQGDANGFGSLVCEAPAAAVGDWTCSPDARKFDSPIMFAQGDEIYLIARRQLANDGRFDLGLRFLPHPAQALIYQAVYWVTPKRTALWRVDQATRSIEWVLDLPSRGDTAFPGIVRLSENEVRVFNYTSPLEGWDRPWVIGQLGPTQIYSTKLTFTDR